MVWVCPGIFISSYQIQPATNRHEKVSVRIGCGGQVNNQIKNQGIDGQDMGFRGLLSY
jgi:hypothetical protein